MKKLMMSNEVLKSLVNNLKGKILNENNINKELEKLGFKKLPDISISHGYRIDEKTGWIELRSCNNKIRVVLNNEGIVL